MRPISRKIRAIIDTDPFYRKCCVTDEPGPSMQHCWIYRRAQIDETWAIVPLARRYNTSHPPRDIVEKCQLVSLIRANPEDLAKYPRYAWALRKRYLISKHPEFYQLSLKKYAEKN